MELSNRFRVNVPVDEAWAVLTDVPRIAPCMPGAELQEVDGDEYRGIVKVKVGPITAQYKGKATFVERDETGHKAVLRAEGRDSRGAGNASATITATLETDGDGTFVQVDTDLTVTGKVAQFGRGVLADVSGKLITQFVECLEANVLVASPTATEPVEPADATAAANGRASGNGATVATAAAEPAPTPAAEPSAPAPPFRSAEPVDLLDAAGVPLAKRAIPLVAGVLLIYLYLRRRRRRHGRTA